MLVTSDLLDVVHIQPILSIEVCCHFLQVNTARRDPITSSETWVTYKLKYNQGLIIYEVHVPNRLD